MLALSLFPCFNVKAQEDYEWVAKKPKINFDTILQTLLKQRLTQIEFYILVKRKLNNK